MSKEIQEQLDETNAVLHQAWLSNPVTQALIKALFKHKDHFVDLVSANVSNGSMADASFRQLAVNIKNTDAILQLVTNTETFINAINKK